MDHKEEGKTLADNQIASVVAWLRGQEFVGDRYTRGQSADAIETLQAQLSAANDRLAALEADGKRLREAIDPYHQRLLWNFAEGCYMHDMERKDLDALNAALSHEQQEEKREG